MIVLTGIKAAWSLVTKHRSWLTLLVVAAAAAVLWGFYAHAQARLNSVTAERDRAFEWRHRVCLVAGINTKAKGFVKGQCEAAIAGLVRFKGDTLTASNTALAKGIEDGRRKADLDLAAASATAARLSAAAAAMEKANAQVGPDDRVDGVWFTALNAVGGLRQPAK